MAGTYYEPGGSNVICDRTGYKVKRSECRKEWNGLVVRRESFEERHPQDFLRSFEDDQSVADPRPEAVNSFQSTDDSSYTIWDSGATTWDNANTLWVE